MEVVVHNTDTGTTSSDVELGAQANANQIGSTVEVPKNTAEQDVIRRTEPVQEPPLPTLQPRRNRPRHLPP